MRRSPSALKRAAVLTAALVFVACESGTAPDDKPGPPAAVIDVTGDGQIGNVGSSLTIAPQVRVEDAKGRPVPDVLVTFATAPGGSVANASALTDAAGLASAGTWSLGTATGAYTLTATAGGASTVLTATATAAAPASLGIVDGADQSVQVGMPVPVPPAVSVRDEYGNPVPNVEVTFLVQAGAGSLSPQSAGMEARAHTDNTGVARIASWTLGTAVGPNALLVTAPGLEPVTITATALPGPAATLQAISLLSQTAPAGTAVTPPAVRVRDAHGNDVPNVTVNFQVTTGGGSVANTSAQTGEDGIASAGEWKLGVSPGANAVTASSGLLAPVTFTATGTTGVPAQILKVPNGDGQTAQVGQAVLWPPAVRVLDGTGLPVQDATVTFEVIAGGGSVTGAVVQTSIQGYAVVESWKMGPTPGLNRLRASVGNLSTEFTATATAPPPPPSGGGGYQIDLVFTTSVTPTQQAAFQAAAARWESLITGDLTDIPLNINAGSCGTTSAFSQTVDDLVIFIAVKAIDGPGSILGQAGPCLIRTVGMLPVAGLMSLDAADLAMMESNGTLADVITHEMGHVIGIGTMWGGQLVGAGGADPYFPQPGAVAAFDAAGGGSYGGNKVPVENTGGPGTRDGHWRESVFNNELMTGWINGSGNPLSAITAAALGDMGYVVDPGAADGYVLPGSIPSLARPAPQLQLIEGPRPTVQRVNPDGTIQRN